MAEQKTAQQFVRDQYVVAENFAENWLRVANDLGSATSAFAFDAFEKNFHYSQESRAQAERLVQEAVANYRRMYQDSLNAWQSYVKSISTILTQAK